MRRVRVVIGVAAALCAFGALTASAFAKEKLVFGKFAASIVGKPITPSSPAAVKENKEDEAELTGLQLGQYKFGSFNKEDGKFEYEEPCLKPPTVTGSVFEEQSSSLQTYVAFKQCVNGNVEHGIVGYKSNSFKMAIKFMADEAGELSGEGTVGMQITEPTAVIIKGGSQPCLVEIPAQFVPAKAGVDEEKFYEAAEYTPEEEEPENWEKSKKLKEEFPTGVQDRLEIETTEKFKGIRSFVDTATATDKKGCQPAKGEESGKLVTEKEIEVEGKMVANPHYLWTEFTNGKIDMNVEGLEIKGGQLTFEPPA
jgi:hypothetical protein